MSFNLSSGALETIMNGGEVIQPVVQVLGSKVIAGQSSNDRYRLLISDGAHLSSFAMLATQLTPMLKSGQLTDNSVVRITNHVVSMIKNPGKGDKRIMVILGMEIVAVGSEVGSRIGNPVQLPDSSNSASSAKQSSASQSNQKLPDKSNGFDSESSGSGGGITYSKRNSLNDTKLNSSPAPGQATHPIAGLSPYQNSWVIKARVTSKSNIRTWNNARGEGKLFSMDLVDSSGEIRATAFNELVDKFYDTIQENKLYFVSKGRLKMANKQYTTINNDYEMSFTSETKIVPCGEDDASIPTLQFNFATLTSIQEASPGDLLDIIGICKSAGDIMNLTSRTTNRELKKRDVILVDNSLASVTLTLWGSQAEEFSGDGNPVVAVKGAKVSEYQGGKSISLISGSVLQINPDLTDSHRLRGWFDCLTPDAKFNPVSAQNSESSSGKFYLLAEAINLGLGCGDKADYFNCFAMVMHIRTEKPVYKACPTPDCQKKVIDQNNGLFRCEKCNREFENFKYRLILSVNVSDYSGNQWVTLFQDNAEELLGRTADDVGRLQEENSQEFNNVFKAITLKPFQFRLRAKMETFNDERRLKVTVFSAKKPDYKEICKRYISEIKEMSGVSISH